MDETREQILKAAAAVLAENGFANASMNDIVRASGLSKGGVFWHFSSKNEIVVEIFNRYFDAQIDALDRLLHSQELASTRLQTFARMAGSDLEVMVAQFPSSLDFYALAARDTPLRQRLTYYFDVYRERIQQLVRQGIDAGEWDTDTIDTAADAIIALFEGTLLIWSVLPESIDLSERLSSTLAILLRGLRPPDATKAMEAKE